MSDYSKICIVVRNGRVSAKFRLFGKQIMEFIGEEKYLSKSAIEAKKRAITEKLAKGEYLIAKKRFDQMAQEYLKYAKANRTARTYETYEGHMKKLTDYFRKTLLSKISPWMIERYMEHRRKENPKISNKMLINELFTLSALFTLAVKWDYVKENPVKRIEKPKYIRPEMKFFTKAEIALILANCSRYLKGIILLGLTTGMRSAEILNLKWANIDMENDLIHIKCDETFTTKNKKNRFTPIVSDLKNELLFLKSNWVDPLTNKVYPRQEHQLTYVFCHGNGNRVSYFSQGFNNLMKRLGIEKATPHSMRHTFITYHSNYGDPFLTRIIAGHSDQRTTQGYYHAQTDRMKDSMSSIMQMMN